ncbi:DUF6529 family protein [Streptomyces sp. NPDC048564]
MRVLLHLILGCFFFGILSAKMLLIHAKRFRPLVLPPSGFFRTFGVTT